MDGWAIQLAAGMLAAVCVVTPGAADADSQPLEAETVAVAKLPPIHPHWLFVNDANFLGYMDSKIYLLDADSGRMLGMASTGGYRNAFEFAADGKHIYSPETYYARVSRGEKTEVIAVYDLEGLRAVDEVVIPPIRATGAPQRGYSGITDDRRFVLVANQTPAMSVTVVDMKQAEVTARIDTPGCIIVLPTGPRSFALMCGTGNLMHVTIDENGKLADRQRTAVFFDPARDPVAEDGIRSGGRWYLFSFAGEVFEASVVGGRLVVEAVGSLADAGEFAEGWRPGGGQFSAATSDRVFVLMNPDGDYAHKNPGHEIWVFETRPWHRVARWFLMHPASQIAASTDASPIVAVGGEGPPITILDAVTGRPLRQLEGPLLGAGIMQFPPAALVP